MGLIKKTILSIKPCTGVTAKKKGRKNNTIKYKTVLAEFLYCLSYNNNNPRIAGYIFIVAAKAKQMRGKFSEYFTFAFIVDNKKSCCNCRKNYSISFFISKYGNT